MTIKEEYNRRNVDDDDHDGEPDNDDPADSIEHAVQG